MAQITLGGANFELPPFTLGQLRLLLDALDEMAGKSGGALVAAAAKTIHAALRRCRPELTLDEVLALEATIDEVTTAVGAIIHLAGLKPVGEAMPVAGSATSMPPSPPAAATPTA